MNIGGYPMKIACISPDGTKIALTTNSNSTVLYSLNAEGWTEIGRTDILLYNLFFSKDGTTVYVAGYEKLEKRSADSFSLISDYSLQGGYFQSVDLDRERIFYVTSKEFEHKIADLNTGQVLRTIILGNSWCRLFENYLVASGLQLTLPEFE
jgi:DNA-binding beta-propeller fold protein YncE